MAGKRRGRIGLIIVGVLALLLAGAYFIVDSGLRSFAQDRAEAEISKRLPASVSGDFEVTIGGASVIAQFLLGNFDRVELDAPKLTADGVPASVHVVATDVPTNTAVAIGDVKITLDLAPEALNTLVEQAGSAPGTTLSLGEKDVTYTGTLPLLGVDVGYEATATPAAAGDSIVFTPTDAKLTTELGGLDVSAVVALVLGQQPIAVCVAQYLPEGATLTDVEVSPERARIRLESSSLMLSSQSLSTLGSCSG